MKKKQVNVLVPTHILKSTSIALKSKKFNNNEKYAKLNFLF